MSKDSRIYLRSTLAYCSNCQANELARIVADSSGVFMERTCEETGLHRVKIAADYEWYVGRMQAPREIKTTGDRGDAKRGCPWDCGLCSRHCGDINLPIFSITNDCNLNCPICFTYNRPDRKYYKSISETKEIIGQILEKSGGVELINLTGGEPTMHPDLFEIIDTCKAEGIGRITMNTNGIKIAQDRDFAERIKESGVQLVMSLDTLCPEKSVRIHGRDITEEKKAALKILEELDIATTLLPVCIKGLNEEDITAIVRDYFPKPFVRSITIQNMTFTGKNGSDFTPRLHITIDEVEDLLTRIDGFSKDDFFALGSYHPLCYSVAYYFVHQQRILPLTKLIPAKTLTECSRNSYLISANSDFSREFRDGIDRLWAEGEDPKFIDLLRKFILHVYPPTEKLSAAERQERSEKMVKMIYIHPHMDQDNFDLDRVCCCGDLVPDESGRMIPACSYNLLYRQQDSRFWVEN